MEMKVMTVTNILGMMKEKIINQETKEEKIIDVSGSIRPVVTEMNENSDIQYDNLSFYAMVKPYDISKLIDDDWIPPHKVKIIMLLGGDESGLFRHPRVGEKVLAAKADDEEYYLLGFVPDNFNSQGSCFTPPPQYSKPQVLRYKNTGENFTKLAHSEIGFSSKPGGYNGFTLDEIGIKSTGNIANYASNNYSINADSYSLVVGDNNHNNASINITSDGKITIRALDSIDLIVGRTSMSISDKGFVVKSKITDSPMETSWDAVMSLKPLSGFFAAGANCTLSAAQKAVICDSMGGALVTNMGTVAIKGCELALRTMGGLESKLLMLFNWVDFVGNATTVGFGMEQMGRQQAYNYAQDSVDRTDESVVSVKELNDAEAAMKKAQAELENAIDDLRQKKAAYQRNRTTDNQNAWDTAYKYAEKKKEDFEKSQDAYREKLYAAYPEKKQLEKMEKTNKIVSFTMKWVNFAAGILKDIGDMVMGLFATLRTLDALQRAKDSETQARDDAALAQQRALEKEREDKTKAETDRLKAENEQNWKNEVERRLNALKK